MNGDVIGVIAAIVIPCIVAWAALGQRKEVEFDCDLCGRHTKTRVWESSKAAACNVCDACAEIEAQSERMYMVMDGRK